MSCSRLRTSETRDLLDPTEIILEDQRLNSICRTDVQYIAHNVQAGCARIYNADFSSPAVTSGVPGLVVLALAVVLAAPPG